MTKLPKVPAAPGRDERVVARGDVPPATYAKIRMAMGVATYRGVWPVGVRAPRGDR